MKVVASEAVCAFVRERGGRLWVWLDPHSVVSATYVWLATSTEPLRTTRATRRMRSAKHPHRFRSFPADGFEILLDPGRLDPPQELHLELKGWPRKRVAAYWEGFVFVEDRAMHEPPPGPRTP